MHHLPVRVIGVGGGFDYGTAGLSHYGLEDLGVLRLQPDLTIIAPADFQQAQTALRQTWDAEGPIYYRLGRDEQTTVPGLNGAFAARRVEIVRTGEDLLWIVSGSIATEVTTAAARLAQDGITSTIAIVASVSPPPIDDLLTLLRASPAA